MALNQIPDNHISTSKIIWKRNDVAEKVYDFERAKGEQTQRQFAKGNDVPRTTLQYWLSRKDSLDASPALVDFLESPDGNAFLHRMVTAAHFEFGKNSAASAHNISNFFKLCGLDPFLAASYTTQNRIANKMDNAIISYGETEKKKLAENMPCKEIAMCEDETYHPDICMVAIEPVSNFIIIEKYVEKRDGETWNRVISESLEGLPVKVVQVVSDEAQGIKNHTTQGLKAHHSSDCFHVSQEISKGTSGALSGAVKKAEKQCEIASKAVQKQQEVKEEYENRPDRPRGRKPNFEKKIEEAAIKEKEALAELEKARQNQEVVRNARQEIGKCYHPYDLETGKEQDMKKVESLLEACFEEIEIATVDLSDRCKKRVEKAHRVVKNMVANIAFYYLMIGIYLDNIRISNYVRQIMQAYLIPGCYLKQASQKERNVDKKEALAAKSEELLSVLTDPEGPCADLSEKEISILMKAAEECAGIFQRSSSCVEGRNAQLSLKHHGMHRLSDQHLKALTVVHNFHIRRRDGTTAAERFFEAKHRDLFEWLLDNMDYPARPRKRFAKAA